MFRSTIFWLHLICGVAAGLVILMMSVTGVLLTYERQILAWAEGSSYQAAPGGAERLPLEDLIVAATLHRPDFTPTNITVRNEPDAPIALSNGRSTVVIDPHSGNVVEPAAAGLRSFFSAVTGWHRWFNATGDSRAAARAITGASNVAFLFLVLSGTYLWLPRVYKWAAFKMRLRFNPQAKTGKARDFNWHHVFGIWSAVPLAVVVATATVFSYPWASDLVYRSFGEEPPRRGGERGAGGPPPRAEPQPAASHATRLGYDQLLDRAAAHGEWRTLTFNIPPNAAATSVRIGIDEGNGGQPQYRHTLTLNTATGGEESWAPFSSQSTGQQARLWIRFLHTGEALGVVGQTIAGLVSLTSAIMVWTGLALAWRRLVQPLLRRRATPRP